MLPYLSLNPVYATVIVRKKFIQVLIVTMVFLCGLLIFRNAEAKDRQERANKILVNVKAGIEHLADKLQHLKAVRTLNIKKKGLEIVETDIYAFKKCNVLHNCDSE